MSVFTTTTNNNAYMKYVNGDLPGSDMTNGGIKYVVKMDDCEDICAKLSGNCTHFAYLNGTCYPKNFALTNNCNGCVTFLPDNGSYDTVKSYSAIKNGGNVIDKKNISGSTDPYMPVSTDPYQCIGLLNNFINGGIIEYNPNMPPNQCFLVTPGYNSSVDTGINLRSYIKNWPYFYPLSNLGSFSSSNFTITQYLCPSEQDTYPDLQPFSDGAAATIMITTLKNNITNYLTISHNDGKDNFIFGPDDDSSIAIQFIPIFVNDPVLGNAPDYNKPFALKYYSPNFKAFCTIYVINAIMYGDTTNKSFFGVWEVNNKTVGQLIIYNGAGIPNSASSIGQNSYKNFNWMAVGNDSVFNTARSTTLYNTITWNDASSLDFSDSVYLSILNPSAIYKALKTINDVRYTYGIIGSYCTDLNNTSKGKSGNSYLYDTIHNHIFSNTPSDISNIQTDGISDVMYVAYKVASTIILNANNNQTCKDIFGGNSSAGCLIESPLSNFCSSTNLSPQGLFDWDVCNNYCVSVVNSSSNCSNPCSNGGIIDKYCETHSSDEMCQCHLHQTKVGTGVAPTTATPSDCGVYSSACLNYIQENDPNVSAGDLQTMYHNALNCPDYGRCLDFYNEIGAGCKGNKAAIDGSFYGGNNICNRNITICTNTQIINNIASNGNVIKGNQVNNCGSSTLNSVKSCTYNWDNPIFAGKVGNEYTYTIYAPSMTVTGGTNPPANHTVDPLSSSCSQYPQTQGPTQVSLFTFTQSCVNGINVYNFSFDISNPSLYKGLTDSQHSVSSLSTAIINGNSSYGGVLKDFVTNSTYGLGLTNPSIGTLNVSSDLSLATIVVTANGVDPKGTCAGACGYDYVLDTTTCSHATADQVLKCVGNSAQCTTGVCTNPPGKYGDSISISSYLTAKGYNCTPGNNSNCPCSAIDAVLIAGPTQCINGQNSVTYTIISQPNFAGLSPSDKALDLFKGTFGIIGTIQNSNSTSITVVGGTCGGNVNSDCVLGPQLSTKCVNGNNITVYPINKNASGTGLTCSTVAMNTFNNINNINNSAIINTTSLNITVKGGKCGSSNPSSSSSSSSSSKVGIIIGGIVGVIILVGLIIFFIKKFHR